MTWSDADGGAVWKAPAPGAAKGSPDRLTKVPAHYSNPEWSPSSDRTLRQRSPAIAALG